MGVRRRGIEPLGAVMQRDATLTHAASTQAPPISPRDWESAVGTRIAARARPVRLERGVLLVRAATATWSQELTLLADVIVAQLRARGVAVDSLRFRVGSVDPPERPPSRQEVRTSPPSAPLPPEVSRELGHIADPDLREVIARAAAKNLGWQTQQQKHRHRERTSTSPERSGRAGHDGHAEREGRGDANGKGKSTGELETAPNNDGPAEPSARKPSVKLSVSGGGAKLDATSARAGAPGPQSAASGSARSDRSSPRPAGARRGKP